MLKIESEYVYHNLRAEIYRTGVRKEDDFARIIGMNPRTLKSRLKGQTTFTVPEVNLISETLKEISGNTNRLDYKYLFIPQDISK